jgi:hypothetical protein
VAGKGDSDTRLKFVCASNIEAERERERERERGDSHLKKRRGGQNQRITCP